MSLEIRPYQWPKGKRCAFVFSADVDGESPYLWMMRGQKINALGQLEQRRFGPRAGLARIVDLLAQHDLPGSFYVPGYIADLHPDILPGLLEKGHEVGLHGYHHEAVHTIDEDENRKILEKCLKVFRVQTGVNPPGYRSPAWELSPSMHGLLREFGLAYDSSLMGYDHPYTLEGLTEVPVQWLTDDAIYFRYFGGGKDFTHPANPKAVLESWIEEFEGIREFGGLFMVTIHPWMSGRGQRIRLLRALFTHVQQYDDVWCTTAAAVAEHHQKSPNHTAFSESLQIPSTDY